MDGGGCRRLARVSRRVAYHTGAVNGGVWLVGAGPGDPGLVTRAGLEALRRADVVVCDALAPRALLREAPPHAEIVEAGKRAGAHAMSQRDIEALLVARARAGRRVVRLKGGDPFVFGRGGEELAACRAAGVPCAVVPGVSSALAAPAWAGIPLTHRGTASAFMVVNGRDARAGGANWRAAAAVDTLVLLMGAATLGECAERLLAEGRAPHTPAAAVRWGTRADQRTVHGALADIAARVAAAGLDAPLVTVVGEVAALAGELAWFEPGPLAGRRVAVTRARPGAGVLAAMLEAEGASVVEAPAIELRPAPPDALREAVGAPAAWWVFASANGVAAALDALAALGLDARALAGRRLAAIGEATAAALAERGLRADFVPARATAGALARLPAERGEAVTLFQSALAAPDLARALAARGLAVRAVTAYENRPAPLDAARLAELDGADAVLFASSSSARALRLALGADAPAPRGALVSIGPRTSASVRDCFGRVDREAAAPSLDGLVRAALEVLGAP